MIIEQSNPYEFYAPRDLVIEITPGAGAHRPGELVIIVCGGSDDGRVREIARRIERLLGGELDDAQRCETIARGPNAGKRCTRPRGHKGLHWVRVATNEVPPTETPDDHPDPSQIGRTEPWGRTDEGDAVHRLGDAPNIDRDK